MPLAHNEKLAKNGQKRFWLSTKTSQKRAKTIMPVRYKSSVWADISKKMDDVGDN